MGQLRLFFCGGRPKLGCRMCADPARKFCKLPTWLRENILCLFLMSQQR